MVNVSTLIYVLDNLEEEKNELINLEEILELEDKYLKKIFDLIDQKTMQVRPVIVDNILKTASTE